MKERILGIQAKILFSLGIAGILPGILVTSLLYSQVSQIVKTNAGESFQKIAIQAADKLKTSLLNQETQLKSLSLSPTLNDLILKNENKEASQHYLNRFLMFNSNQYKQLSLINKEGKIIVSSDPILLSDKLIVNGWKKTIKQGKSLYYLEEKRDPKKIRFYLNLHIIVPIFHFEESVVIGALHGVLNFNSILKYLSQLQVGKTGKACFVASKEAIYYCSVSSGQILPAAGLTHSINFDQNSGWFIAKKEGGLKSLKGYATIVQETSPQLILNQSSQWMIFIEQDLNETLAPLYGRMYLVLALCLAILLIAFVIGIRTTQGTIYSIMKLRKHAKSVGLGHLSSTISIDRHDELGELAHSFNQMVENLNKLKNESDEKSEALTTINEELKQQNEIKKRFIETISHDFKSPLTTLSGYIKLLKEGKSGPITHEQYENLNLINKQIQQLTYLITQLLHMAQLESGHLESNAIPVYFQAVLEDGLKAIEDKINSKEIVIENSVNKNLPMVFGDKNQLIQIAMNLLENAVKYTHTSGKITLTSKEQEEFIEFSIKNTGEGIPPEYMNKIFDRFFRVKEDSKEKGFGIGLSIVKELVEKNKGRIWVESQPHKDTQFFFILPKYAP